MNNILIKSADILSLLLAVVFTVSAANAEDDNRQKVKDGCITVTDCANRNVLIPENITRIACLYLFAGHAVTMLGRGDDIVAVSNGLKRVSLLLDICPSIKYASVPKTQGALNMEELLNASPDVLFVAGEMSRNRDEMEKLDRFGLPTIIIDYSDMESQQKAISIIGKVIGREERAEEYNRFYRKTVERIRSVTDKLPEDKKLRLYYSENEATRTTLDNDLSTDWLSVTGSINVALNHSGNILEGKNFVGIEQILVWNPQVILANEPEALKLMLEDRKWGAVDAVNNGRVYQMPIAISRWGHPGSIETPMAILWTANKIYPSLFPEINMKTETKNYYKHFFNYDLSESKIKAILEGELIRKPKHAPGDNRQQKRENRNGD